MSFLYGNNVTKAGLGRITENTPQYAGVVVYSMSDLPLGKHQLSAPSTLAVRIWLPYIMDACDVGTAGFGLAAQPTEYCNDLDQTQNVVLHQADIGEYVRVEDEMF